jgi:hypothetical protein
VTRWSRGTRTSDQDARTRRLELIGVLVAEPQVAGDRPGLEVLAFQLMSRFALEALSHALVRRHVSRDVHIDIVTRPSGVGPFPKSPARGYLLMHLRTSRIAAIDAVRGYLSTEPRFSSSPHLRSSSARHRGVVGHRP